ncbi:MAG: phosphoribosylglycinamide formyltransferase [Candidatus Binatia bacterium]|nr:phosphoribosylglycinamide formyltransferase [Candidatus Binatia bacterium]
MNLGILISGRGSNLKAILTAVAEHRLDATSRVVVSNRAGVGGLEYAQKRDIPTSVVPHGEFATRALFDEAVVEILRAHDVDTVALAGFDRLITPVLLDAFPGHVVNVHPALLPSFPGLHAQRQALEYGARVTGVTVHLVDEQMDHGPILAQAAVPVLDDDTEESLASRILEEEHRIYPLALQRLADGAIRVEGRRVLGGVPST